MIRDKKLDMRVSEEEKKIIKEAGALAGETTGEGYLTWARGVLLAKSNRMLAKAKKESA